MGTFSTGSAAVILDINPDRTISRNQWFRIQDDSANKVTGAKFSNDGDLLALVDTNGYINMFTTFKPPLDTGTVNLTVDSSISLTLNDDTVDLSDIPGSTDVVTDDNEMNYTVTTNNLEGYTVTIKADNATLDSATAGNSDNIPVDLITVAQSDSQNGTGSNATVLSSTNDNQLYTQDERSIEAGDTFTSTFNLTEIPWVNADDYSGTVTYTATAN